MNLRSIGAVQRERPPRARPRRRAAAELLELYGFGQTRAVRYGAGFLAVIAGYLRG